MAKKKQKKNKKKKLSQSTLDQRAAQKIVNQELAPTVAEINRQKTEAAANATQRQNFINSMTQTAAGMAQSYAPAVQGAFQTAAQDQTAFGKGYSDAFKSAQNQAAAKTNTILQQSGAPQAQMAAGDTGAADALYGIAGAQPGSTLATEGAAFTSAAAKLPSTTALSGRQYGVAASQQDAATMKDILAQLTQVQLKKPGLINDVISQIQTNRSKSQQQSFDNRLAADALGLKVKSENASNKYKYDALNSTNAYRSATLKQNAAKIKVQMQKVSQGNRQKISTALSNMMGYFVDSYGSPVLGKNGKLVSVPKSSSLDTKTIVDIAETVKEGKSGIQDTKTGRWKSPPNTPYMAVYRDLVAAYPDAGGEIKRVLNMYYKVGELGRPWDKKVLQGKSTKSIFDIYSKIPDKTYQYSGAYGSKPNRAKMIAEILTAGA